MGARRKPRSCSLEDLLVGVCPGVLIPPGRRSRIYGRLIGGGGGAPGSPVVIVDASDDDDLALLAVCASDWPGLATICLGELQYHGWNLDIAEGFAVDDGGSRRGFVIAGIRDSDPVRRARFAEDALGLQGLLERLAEGRADTLSLMARASERLEIYERIRTSLQRLLRGRPLPEALTGPSGELVLFISSRSDEYLRERRPMDLARMVLTNFDLVEGVRSRRGRTLFKIRNLRTTREHLTGINIAGYERDISFQDCLTALGFAWPGSTIRHQRRYTTGDGIISIRLEMTGPLGLAASREETVRMTDTLRKLLVRNELERLKRIHRYGGRENYARALIPLLLRECESSRLTQVYIALESTTTFLAELKLLIVMFADGIEEHDAKILSLVGEMDALEGMTVVSFKSPSNFGRRWVDLIDVTVQRDAHPEIETAYEAIKGCMERSLGSFRDFDMGMRLNDAKQLREIREMLPGIPESTVTDFYYSLEDFLRASAPVDELSLHIRLAFDTMSEALRSGGGGSAPRSAVVVHEGAAVASLFCCVLPEGLHTFQVLLDMVKEYRVTASLIDWSNRQAALLRVNDGDAALPEGEVRRVLEELGRICCPEGTRP